MVLNKYWKNVQLLYSSSLISDSQLLKCSVEFCDIFMTDILSIRQGLKIRIRRFKRSDKSALTISRISYCVCFHLLKIDPYILELDVQQLQFYIKDVL